MLGLLVAIAAQILAQAKLSKRCSLRAARLARCLSVEVMGALPVAGLPSFGVSVIVFCISPPYFVTRHD